MSKASNEKLQDDTKASTDKPAFSGTTGDGGGKSDTSLEAIQRRLDTIEHELSVMKNTPAAPSGGGHQAPTSDALADINRRLINVETQIKKIVHL